MKPAAVACAGLLAVSASAGAAGSPIALVASPARVTLAGAASTTVRVRSSGTEPIVLDVAPSGFALDLRGRPRVVRRRLTWLTVTPSRIALGPHGVGTVRVSASVPAHARPGDHAEVVLLTGRRAGGAGLAVRVRLGVVVVVRVPGKVVHRLALARLRVRPWGRVRLLELLLRNQGTVAETVGGRCASITLSRGTRRLVTLRFARREVLPHTRGLVAARYRGTLRGPVTARVVLLGGCGGPRARAFAVRL